MNRMALAALWLWLSALPLLYAATSQSTAFTYQGSLSASGAPASGNFDLTFKLFDSDTGPNQIGPTRSMPQFPVVNGVFTTDLDFGAPFNGAQLWLEVTVAGQTLTPRQPVNAVPVAQFALNGVTGAPGANGHNSLIAQSAEPSGAHCTAGGVKIASGADTNGNGVLDANEVTASSYICSLTSAPALPPGCSTQPLSWDITPVTYNASDPQPGVWPGINTGATVHFTPHAIDPNSCSGGNPVTPISYSWAIVAAPAGSQALVFPANGLTPVLVPDVPGMYQVAVTAIDAIGLASPVALVSLNTSLCGVNPVSVGITVTPDPVKPGVYALDRYVATIDNDSSQCPARFATFVSAYAWSVLSSPPGSAWQLTNPTAASTSFTSTDPGLFDIHLVVHNSNNQSGFANAQIVIAPPGNPPGL